MITVQTILNRALRRSLADRSMLLAGRGVLAGLIAAAMLLAVDRLLGWRIDRPWFALPPAAGAAAGIAWAFVTRPRRDVLARRIDRVLGLKDRIGTAHALEAQPASPAIDPGFAALARRDAQRLAGSVDVARAVPVQPTRVWWAATLLAAGLAAGVMFIPAIVRENAGGAGAADGKPALTAAQVEEAGKQSQDLSRSIDEALTNLPDAGSLDDAAKAKLESLDRIAAQLKQPLTPEAARDLARTRDESAAQMSELAERLQRQAERNREAAAQLAERFKGLQETGAPEPPAPADEFTKALERGDFDQAAKELDRLLDGKELSPEDRQSVADHLRHLAEEARKADAAPRPEADRERSKALRDSLRDHGLDDAAIDRAFNEPDDVQAIDELQKQLHDRGVDPEIADRLASQAKERREQDRVDRQADRDAKDVGQALDRAADDLERPDADADASPSSSSHESASQPSSASSPQTRPEPTTRPDAPSPAKPADSPKSARPSASRPEADKGGSDGSDSAKPDNARPDQSSADSKTKASQGSEQDSNPGSKSEDGSRSTPESSTAASRPDDAAKPSPTTQPSDKPGASKRQADSAASQPQGSDSEPSGRDRRSATETHPATRPQDSPSSQDRRQPSDRQQKPASGEPRKSDQKQSQPGRESSPSGSSSSGFDSPDRQQTRPAAGDHAAQPSSRPDSQGKPQSQSPSSQPQPGTRSQSPASAGAKSDSEASPSDETSSSPSATQSDRNVSTPREARSQPGQQIMKPSAARPDATAQPGEVKPDATKPDQIESGQAKPEGRSSDQPSPRDQQSPSSDGEDKPETNPQPRADQASHLQPQPRSQSQSQSQPQPQPDSRNPGESPSAPDQAQRRPEARPSPSDDPDAKPDPNQPPSETLRRLADRLAKDAKNGKISEDLIRRAKDIADRMTPEERQRWADQWNRENQRPAPPSPDDGRPENPTGDQGKQGKNEPRGDSTRNPGDLKQPGDGARQDRPPTPRDGGAIDPSPSTKRPSEDNLGGGGDNPRRDHPADRRNDAPGSKQGRHGTDLDPENRKPLPASEGSGDAAPVDIRGDESSDELIAQWLSPDRGKPDPKADPSRGASAAGGAAEQRIRAAQSVAERAVNDAAVQKRYHNPIRRYFDRLNGTFGPTATAAPAASRPGAGG